MKKIVSVFLAVVVFAFANERKLTASRNTANPGTDIQLQQQQATGQLRNSPDGSISKQVQDDQIINL